MCLAPLHVEVHGPCMFSERGGRSGVEDCQEHLPFVGLCAKFFEASGEAAFFWSYGLDNGFPFPHLGLSFKFNANGLFRLGQLQHVLRALACVCATHRKNSWIFPRKVRAFCA